MHLPVRTGNWGDEKLQANTFDLLLTSEEEQNVTRSLYHMDLQSRSDGSLLKA